MLKLAWPFFIYVSYPKSYLIIQKVKLHLQFIIITSKLHCTDQNNIPNLSKLTRLY